MTRYSPPTEVIDYVWKTGFVTKKIWKTYFFKGQSERSMFRDWKNLIDRGYLEPHSNSDLENILVLNRRNKSVLKLREDYPVYAPNPAQLEHDKILLNGILELSKNQLLDQWQTEAELKMLRHSDYRVEIQGLKIKYPDAILYFQNGDQFQTVAVEYERVQKCSNRYSQIMSAYATFKKVDAVIWIVSSMAIQNTIIEQGKQVYYPFKERPIGFVGEQVWKSNPEELLELANEIIVLK